MQIPSSIEFVGNCTSTLRKTLLACAPDEGCALLIGDISSCDSINKNLRCNVKHIWTCSNNWTREAENLIWPSKENQRTNSTKPSRKNRFLIDPSDQISAQRWSRRKGLRIIGNAHSHPLGPPIPSKIDCKYSFEPSLMVIVGQFGEICAWWIESDMVFQEIKINNSSDPEKPSKVFKV